MSELFDRFKTNKEKEKSGHWYTIHVNEDGTKIEFLIARTGARNNKYLKEVAKLTRPYSSMSDIPPALTIELNQRAYLATCVLGWKNVELRDGPLTFNLENLKLVSDELPDLIDNLMAVSADRANFQDVSEDDSKNLSTA